MRPPSCCRLSLLDFTSSEYRSIGSIAATVYQSTTTINSRGPPSTVLPPPTVRVTGFVRNIRLLGKRLAFLSIVDDSIQPRVRQAVSATEQAGCARCADSLAPLQVVVALDARDANSEKQRLVETIESLRHESSVVVEGRLTVRQGESDDDALLARDDDVDLDDGYAQRPCGISQLMRRYELNAHSLTVLSPGPVAMPFSLDEANSTPTTPSSGRKGGSKRGGASSAPKVPSLASVDESVRGKWRVLELRSATRAHMLRARAAAAAAARAVLSGYGLLEVETPLLFRRTSESGAREFLVPTRSAGLWYTLPQSPQQFKQLLMVGGVPGYFQLARCFRDESGTPDRQPEFTQIDLELANVGGDAVRALTEPVVSSVLTASGCRRRVAEAPWPSYDYHDLMSRYGSDKPDLSYDLELTELKAKTTPNRSFAVALVARQCDNLTLPTEVVTSILGHASSRTVVTAIISVSNDGQLELETDEAFGICGNAGSSDVGDVTSLSERDLGVEAVADQVRALNESALSSKAHRADRGPLTMSEAEDIASQLDLGPTDRALVAVSRDGTPRPVDALRSAAALTLVEDTDASAADATAHRIVRFLSAKADVQLAGGRLRTALAAHMRATDLLPPRADTDIAPFWVVNFPLFEPTLLQSAPLAHPTLLWSLSAAHHPFTAPAAADRDFFWSLVAEREKEPPAANDGNGPEARQEDADAGEEGGPVEDDSYAERAASLRHLQRAQSLFLRSAAYDLVLDGTEVGGGSERIHRETSQREVFSFLGADAGEMSGLLNGLGCGAPPHAGLALGFDRLLSLSLGLPTIRDVLPFPKSSQGRDLTFLSPSSVPADHLFEYHVAVLTGEDDGNDNAGEADKHKKKDDDAGTLSSS